MTLRRIDAESGLICFLYSASIDLLIVTILELGLSVAHWMLQYSIMAVNLKLNLTGTCPFRKNRSFVDTLQRFDNILFVEAASCVHCVRKVYD